MYFLEFFYSWELNKCKWKTCNLQTKTTFSIFVIICQIRLTGNRYLLAFWEAGNLTNVLVNLQICGSQTN